MTATLVSLAFIFLAFLVLFIAVDRGSEPLYWLSVVISLCALAATGFVQS